MKFGQIKLIYCTSLSCDEGDELIPVELDSELMNSVFPVAESIVEEEFGDELGLQRTPQTLTLVVSLLRAHLSCCTISISCYLYILHGNISLPVP